MKPQLIQNANVYALQGEWVAAYAKDLLGFINASGQKQATLHLNGEKLEHLDTVGALAILRIVRSSNAQVHLEKFKSEHSALLEDIARQPEENEKSAATRPHTPLGKLQRAYVKLVSKLIFRVSDSLSFAGELLVKLGSSIIHPSRLRLRSLISQMQKTGVAASSLVALISFLIAIVLAYQGSAQLARFGADIYTVDLVAISVLREMGVLLTAIMVAGRSGSAFAAEIGVMKLNEEIDALKTTGLDPMEILVIPRILALILMMPLLTVFADICGLAGAGVLSMLKNDMSLALFLERLQEAAKLTHFWAGMIKAPVFGLLIGLVGCFHGMQVATSAESAGRETTASVVHAIFLVILADAAFSIVFSELGI